MFMTFNVLTRHDVIILISANSISTIICESDRNIYSLNIFLDMIN